MTGPDVVGIGDADRERVLGWLRQAAEEGRLTPEELDDRVARARVARTAGELEFVLAGLRPGTALPRPAGVPTAAEALAALASVGQRPEAPLTLNAGMSGEKRTGAWVVPPFLRADAGVANVKIDCRQARAGAEVIDLEVNAVAASVVLVLPDGWAVNVDRLGKGMGSIKVRVPGIPAPGCPLFIVHGSVGMGTFKARPENWFERWLLQRQQWRQGGPPALPPGRNA
ncbi:MAG: DUF1707 domain-containing protein [Propionibacteriaceae bacterium]|nr:DUF1707 domain-containing protein [Propionibacteriaceae bacterium]